MVFLSVLLSSESVVSCSVMVHSQVTGETVHI